MSSAAPSFLNPIAAEGEAAGTRLSAEALARRAKQRRQIQGMIGVSYVIDAGILLIYAYAGAVPFWLGPLFALAGPGVVERRALSANVSAMRRGGGMGRALQGA